VRADGESVREEEPEPLDLADTKLEEGAVVTMAVKEEEPLLWRTFAAGRVTLSMEGAVAKQTSDYLWSLTTTGVELSEGKHYWEMELQTENVGFVLFGISRPNLDPTGRYYLQECTDGWLIDASNGGLYGNGMCGDNEAGAYHKGDRVGVLLNLNEGSLRFFKNGVIHGPGFAAGSVSSGVVPALHMYRAGTEGRLLPNAQTPTGW
jgi:hypothetical protein